jgi:hypothetical protein
MSSNSRIAAGLVVAFAGCAPMLAVAAPVCPPRSAQPLRFVDVFDGAPEELATLVPDKAQPRSGHWQLGYVYDSGRTITIRCKYADGKTVDVNLAQRVARCDYKINARKTLALRCQ